MMKVEITLDKSRFCFIGGRRVYGGSIIDVPEALFSPKSMRRVRGPNKVKEAKEEVKIEVTAGAL